MSHFVCTHCQGLAEAPGVCQTPDCPQNGDQLVECNCEDNTHPELSEEGQENLEDGE